MPYQWKTDPDGETTELRLWPHHSLAPGGFVWFIALTAGLIALPLLPLIGTLALWGLLPFALAAIGAIWWAIQRNRRDRSITEVLRLSPGLVTLTRLGPDGERDWQANPHWVQVKHHPHGGPVPHYLTLRGGPREVEIGAFLTEAERLALETELRTRLAALNTPAR